MVRKNNAIRLNEAELHQLIERAVLETINEGKFGNMTKKVGKGLAKGALYGALATGGAAGALYCADKGLENQERYEQQLNKDARMMGLGNERDVQQWLQDRGLEDNEFNREQAYDYFQGQSDDYFKNRENESRKFSGSLIEQKIAQVVRENLQKARRV